MHVAGGEDARDAGFVLVRFSQDIGSRVQVGLESVGDVFLASQETGCDQYQLCVNDFLGTIIMRPLFSSFFGSRLTMTAFFTLPFLSFWNSFTVVL